MNELAAVILAELIRLKERTPNWDFGGYSVAEIANELTPVIERYYVDKGRLMKRENDKVAPALIGALKTLWRLKEQAVIQNFEADLEHSKVIKEEYHMHRKDHDELFFKSSAILKSPSMLDARLANEKAKFCEWLILAFPTAEVLQSVNEILDNGTDRSTT
jgi:hypothetical protein